jgi:hypothetical protein
MKRGRRYAASPSGLVGAREHRASYLRTGQIAVHTWCDWGEAHTCELWPPACEHPVLPENRALCARLVRMGSNRTKVRKVSEGRENAPLTYSEPSFSVQMPPLIQGTRYPSRRHPFTQRRRGVETTCDIAAAGVSQGVSGSCAPAGPALK